MTRCLFLQNAFSHTYWICIGREQFCVNLLNSRNINRYKLKYKMEHLAVCQKSLVKWMLITNWESNPMSASVAVWKIASRIAWRWGKHIIWFANQKTKLYTEVIIHRRALQFNKNVLSETFLTCSLDIFHRVPTSAMNWVFA